MSSALYTVPNEPSPIFSWRLSANRQNMPHAQHRLRPSCSPRPSFASSLPLTRCAFVLHHDYQSGWKPQHTPQSWHKVRKKSIHSAIPIEMLHFTPLFTRLVNIISSVLSTTAPGSPPLPKPIAQASHPSKRVSFRENGLGGEVNSIIVTWSINLSVGSDVTLPISSPPSSPAAILLKLFE